MASAAGDAEALLLAAGHAEGVVLEAVLDLVPERAAPQRALDDLVHVALHAEHPRAEGDVVVDGLRERVGLLEDHPDPLAHLDRVDSPCRRGPRRGRAPAGHGCAGDQVVHPVEAADERALAAAGRADERRDLVLVDRRTSIRERRAGRCRLTPTSSSWKTARASSARAHPCAGAPSWRGLRGCARCERARMRRHCVMRLGVLMLLSLWAWSVIGSATLVSYHFRS